MPTIDNTALANVDLTWETNTTYDIGFDAALFKNALTVSFDYFFRKRENVIATILWYWHWVAESSLKDLIRYNFLVI